MDGRKHATIQAGGQTYNLRISFNALSEFNDRIGPLADFTEKPLKAFRGLLWAGINAYGSQSVTLEQSGDICEDYIADKGMESFIKTMQALVDSSGWMAQGAGEKNPKGKASLNTSVIVKD